MFFFFFFFFFVVFLMCTYTVRSYLALSAETKERTLNACSKLHSLLTLNVPYHVWCMAPSSMRRHFLFSFMRFHAFWLVEIFHLFPSETKPSDAPPITKTCLYNFDPLKPHLYILKLGFTGVYIIFLLSAQRHRLWVLLRTASLTPLNPTFI